MAEVPEDIFSGYSIANALKRNDQGIEFLFVGAEGRMEMEKVPSAGYRIIGLPVAGFHRSIDIKEFNCIVQAGQKSGKSRKDCPGIQSRCCSRCGWIRKRTGVKTSYQDEDPCPDSGTEQLCREKQTRYLQGRLL